MLSRHLKVCRYVSITRRLVLTPSTVIARQALAQEDNTDFGNDFPDTIPINYEGERDGCAC